MNAAQVSRDDVLSVLGRIINLRWRGIDAKDVPIRQMQDRIAVLLPAGKFTDDEGIKLNGKFQHLMTQRGAHAYLDFVEGDWKGTATTLDGGFH
jgi:hypothetical protein